MDPLADPLGAMGPKLPADKCSCTKTKSKPRKPRDECWTGTYTQKAKGITYLRRRRVPCK